MSRASYNEFNPSTINNGSPASLKCRIKIAPILHVNTADFQTHII